MKYQYNTSLASYLLLLGIAVMAIVSLVYTFTLDSEAWQKINAVLIFSGLIYILASRTIINVEVDNHRLKINRPWFFNHNIDTELASLDELILNNQGKERYLRLLFKDKTERNVLCSGLSRKDLKGLFKKLKELGVKTSSSYAI